MNFSEIFSIIKKVIDISVVWLAIYYILKNIKKNVKFTFLFKGIILIIVIKIISDWLNLVTVGILFEYIITWVPLALVVIFQPELRAVLEQIGRSQFLGKHKTLTVGEREKLINELGTALETCKKSKIGALIVIERDDSLEEYIERSKVIDAEISSDLLVTIFFPNCPLHDGGVIIRGNKVASAGAVFPTTAGLKFSKRLGTRHRAAIGISEETDCISILVSEETGRISVAVGGELNYNLTVDEAKEIILDDLKPKTTFIEEAEEEINEEDSE